MDNHESLVNIISKASELKKSRVLIVGDFNYKYVNWDTCESERVHRSPPVCF